MPSLSPPWTLALDVALRAVGARRLVPASYRDRLTRIGLESGDLDRVLASIRSLSGWWTAWDRRARVAEHDARRAEDAGDAVGARQALRIACGASLIALGTADPLSEKHRRSQERIRRSHTRLAGLGPSPVERFDVAGPWDIVRGFLRLPPGPGPHPLVLALPPLGHIKEELGVVLDRLPEQGYGVAGLDLPGTGESPGPLPLDAQRIGSSALDQLLARDAVDADRVALLGISLGAYWCFKIAAEDPRPRLTVGISTPVMDARRWRRLPRRLWRAFQGTFAAADIAGARRLATRMTLEGVFQQVRCSTLLFHGGRDRLPIPGVIPWLMARGRMPLEATIYPRAGHGCVDLLEDAIVPAVLRRLDREFGVAARPSDRPICRTGTA